MQFNDFRTAIYSLNSKLIVNNLDKYVDQITTAQYYL